MDGTLITTLNELASAQTKGTQSTMQDTKNLMDYCHTQSDATIRYCASQMQLHIYSDASYLLVSKAISRVGGHFSVLVVASILKHWMDSAAEAGFGGLFNNAKEGEVLRTSLRKMGHPQRPTPMQIDNSTASGIINKTVKQRSSKSIDMRFCWVRDICKQKHFLIY